jgi:hypothetical protein
MGIFSFKNKALHTAVYFYPTLNPNRLLSECTHLRALYRTIIP